MPKKGEEQKADVEKPNSDATGDATQEVHSEPVIKAPFDISKLTASQLKLAKSMGLDVEAMAEWFFAVEARFQAIADQLPSAVEEGVNKALDKARDRAIAEQRRMLQQRRTEGGGGGGGEMSFADVVKAVSGGESETSQSDKFLMDMGRENLITGRLMQREMIKRMMPNVLVELDKELAKMREKGKSED